MAKETAYIKHIYWLTAEEEARLREDLASLEITLGSAKNIACAPLDPISKPASVAPEVWNENCDRQGSWYRASNKNGLYLVISPMDLPGIEDRKAAVITESDFVPPRLAGDEDRATLAADPRYLGKEPAAWKKAGAVEKRIQVRWAKRMGSDVKNFKNLFLSHNANHANFIHPRLFVRDENGIVPYSIERTADLCSCCVELFQILGEEYDRKLVAPCPGAVIFSRLKKDRYLLVTKP